jgi:hypothetical protein
MSRVRRSPPPARVCLRRPAGGLLRRLPPPVASEEEGMNIIRQIERRLGRLLGRDVPTGAAGDKDPSAAAVRFCQYGHTVFDGNNLCNYGHRPA